MRNAAIVMPLLAMLAACSASPRALGEGESAARRPADARIAALYDGSCRACHTRKDSGAPLSGDHAAWDARWARGPDALLQSAVGGIRGMPAGGQCPRCTVADYRALIAFMADQPG